MNDEAPAPISNEEAAAKMARVQFLQQQALGFMNQTRALTIQLMLADQKDEISDDLKLWIHSELVRCAGLLEVKR